MMSSRTYSGLLCTVGGCPTNKFSSRCEHSTVTQIGLGPATKRAEEHGVNLKAKLYAGGWKPLSLGMLVLYPRKVSRVIKPYGVGVHLPRIWRVTYIGAPNSVRIRLYRMVVENITNNRANS